MDAFYLKQNITRGNKSIEIWGINSIFLQIWLFGCQNSIFWKSSWYVPQRCEMGLWMPWVSKHVNHLGINNEFLQKSPNEKSCSQWSILLIPHTNFSKNVFREQIIMKKHKKHLQKNLKKHRFDFYKLEKAQKVWK